MIRSNGGTTVLTGLPSVEGRCQVCGDDNLAFVRAGPVSGLDGLLPDQADCECGGPLVYTVNGRSYHGQALTLPPEDAVELEDDEIPDDVTDPDTQWTPESLSDDDELFDELSDDLTPGDDALDELNLREVDDLGGAAWPEDDDSDDGAQDPLDTELGEGLDEEAADQE